jgi:hypothetical protein
MELVSPTAFIINQKPNKEHSLKETSIPQFLIHSLLKKFHLIFRQTSAEHQVVSIIAHQKEGIVRTKKVPLAAKKSTARDQRILHIFLGS